MKSWDFRGKESHVTGAGLDLKAARTGVFSSSMRLSKSSVVKEEGWGRESWRCSEGLLWWFLACEGLRLCDCDNWGLDIWLRKTEIDGKRNRASKRQNENREGQDRRILELEN